MEGTRRTSDPDNSAAGEACSVVQSETFSCRRVDEDGKAFRECVRTREALRYCLGRAPEVLESLSETTREELPAGGGEPWHAGTGASAWSGPWGWSQGTAEQASLPPPGSSAHAPILGPWGARGFLGPSEGAREPCLAQEGAAEGPGSLPGAQGGRLSLPEAWQELVGSAEASALAALEQLGLELEEFRPFQGLPRLFRLPGAEGAHAHPRPGALGGAGEGPGATSAPVPNAGPGSSSAGGKSDAWRGREKRSVYDDLSRSFEEV